jgi:rSAM/selenodomain-associated transferase 2
VKQNVSRSAYKVINLDARMTPLVSVIVPILAADRDAACQLIARILVDLRVEIIVAEAGTELGLESLSQGRPDVTVVHTRQGRGRQMNAAAALARGQWLLFLHADSQLPPDWLDLFESSVREHGTESGPRPRDPGPGDIVGGWFQFALDDPAWQARLIEQAVAWRVRLLRLPYGDQGLFVQRHTFAALGGYRDIEVMEDVDFARRMINAGAVIELRGALITSARRWRRDGWFRRSTRNLTLLALYFCGVPPRVLARWY